jgi:intracellular multiplication protein IcmL
MTSGTTDPKLKQNLPQASANKKLVKGKHALEENPESASAFRAPLMLRTNFYRDNYRRLIYFCLLLCFGIIGLIAWIAWERTHKPVVTYFATTNQGKLTKLTPMNQPNLTNSALTKWVTHAVTTSYNFNFGNYDVALNDAKVFFTEAGYQHFMNALKAARTLDTVKEKNLVVFAVAPQPAVVIKEGPTADGIYAWQVQLPLLLTYQSASDQIKQNVILTILVARRPTIESPEGIGIASISLREIQ